MNTSASQTGLKVLLALSNFRRLWLGQLISQIGDGVTGLAVLIVINQLTHSTAAVATMAIALALPQLIFGLVAGVYVDRWDRKRTMIVSDLARGLVVLSFVLVREPQDVWILYTAGFVQAAIGTLFGPAKSALLPAIVPPEHLMAANGLSQMTQALTIVVGASLAGLLVGLFASPWPAFCFDALTFFVSAAFIARITAPPQVQPVTQGGRIGAVLAELKEGLVFLAGDRALYGAVVVFAVTMLGAGAVNVLFVPFLVNLLGVRVELLGAVSGAQVLGMIVGGGLVTVLASRLKQDYLISGGVMLMGVLVALIGGAQSLMPVLFAMFAAGVCSTPVQAALTTLLQVRVPADKRGRTGSVMSTAITVASVVSMAFSGMLAQAIGTRQVFFIAGGLVFLAGVLSIWMMRTPEPPGSAVVLQ